jgi:hypothetical protein
VGKIIVISPQVGLTAFKLRFVLNKTGTHVHNNTARIVEPELQYALP